MGFHMKKLPPPAGTASILRMVFLPFTPLAAILACQLVSLQSVSGALRWLVSSPGPALMYYLLLLLVQAAFGGLTRLSGLGGLLAALPPLGLTLASYYKGLINGEPLVIADLELAGKLGNVLGFSSGSLVISRHTWLALLLVLLPFAFLTALDVLSWRDRGPLRWTIRRGLSIAGVSAAALALFVTYGLRPYCLTEYRSFPNQPSRDARLGVSLSLLSSWYHSQPAPSVTYSEGRLRQTLADMEAALERQKTAEAVPHIIFVMNESFTDITQLPGLDFSADPLPNLHRLQGENTTYGRFYTITCGGGTGQVELETFTGVSLEELGGIATALEPELYDAMPSYVRVLKENGYRTISFHGHTAELYNRDRNYPHLGFDQVLFQDAFAEGATYAGGYFDDDSSANAIISLFEENRGGPVYIYTMTMQNHQTYHAGRYPENRVEVSSPLLTAEELEGVTCYVNGLYDADRMLGKLVDYFSAVDEPVLLVFAGDHPPSLPLSQEETVYTRLGVAPSITSAQWSAEDYKNMMVTDYLIWSNYLDGEGQVPNSTMSMGATVLELSGVRNTPFFAWMNQIRRETMLFHARILTLDPSGQVVSGDEPAIRAFRTAYTDVIYDTLYGRHYLGGAVNRVRDP